MTTHKIFAKWLAAAGVLSMALVVGSGCSLEPSVPGSPTYEADVKPILEARCVRCHGYPPQQAALGRFDIYTCAGAADGGAPAGCPLGGVKDLAGLIKGRIQLDKDAVGHMPPKPALPLSQYQVDTIVKWIDSGTPEM
jgi:hypothetical protein